MTETLACADSPAIAPLARDARYYELKREIEEHMYDECELLDTRQFSRWLDTLAEDLVYFMPMNFNVKFGRHAQDEHTRVEKDMSWFNEGKWTLTKRAEQIMTGVHWAEEPLSRLCRVVSNVQLTAIAEGADGALEVDARSRFVMYQNRCEYEEYYFTGRRYDRLRRVGDGWQLVRREIHLPQNVLLAKNLTMFF
ncbi:3-phenylpropionate/cinnamic acid dioxygenase subunit beta [Bordetella bronchiseptica]|uniref:Hydroxylating beta subunit of a dioxygenase system n=5 Tax=Bordetella TaxID=517 RepID=A0A0H3LJ54_BORBR|nr:3-phenylpropionate/cinnamic acid dioxygenase subunit beta [Bordetella bronchiseptica]KAK68256.1 putative biphenyl 2,3-dioxygenase, beta subunit [Bordetella bronchiseptica 980-2]SHS20544.1 3-phenylpropionate dioxygenase subunit beta [Mycobacteroides abscessus subsp. abscessus]AMG87251.1 3-phenylpropionate dioxygenase [Bordetella bronchiseptica]AWP78418.1 3-phenylpropionate dioxygenase [Bordetella bronchiseptica]AWP83233.1 3-phenylpropionate dioxygenase [Bordetella bronchiseptica]